MEPMLTIGELAAAAAVPSTTVRYYERIGLLTPSGRTRSNYRLYDPAAVARLQFIRAAQDTGFTLDDISKLLAFQDGEAAHCRDVQLLIERRLSAIDQRLEELQQFRGTLDSLLTTCRRTRANALPWMHCGTRHLPRSTSDQSERTLISGRIAT